MRKCSAASMDALFAAIAKEAALYLPVNQTGKDTRAKYTRWTEGTAYSRDLNTVRSAKDFFFPQTETLVDFKIEGKNIEIIDPRVEHEDFVVFGVRACDLRAFDVLDNVFLRQDPIDSYYANRREHGVIMTMACTRPAETCFCKTFGIDPARPAGDISCWLTDGELFMEANSEKGKALLEKLSALTEECGIDAVEEHKALIDNRMEMLPLNGLSTENFGSDKTDKLFADPRWKKLSESCLGCGTCTFVCPTCQCYDIKDFNTGHGVRRFRCWDSCMYSEFTKMSAGQPRLSQVERFRQRFMHKLVYYPANNNGLFSCVGCGRCLASCPISMNIVKVIKAFGEEEQANAK